VGHRVIIIPDPQSQTHVTVVALEVETALCDVAAAMEREAEVVSRQREGERKRKVLNKGAAVRDKELEGKAEEVRKRRTKLAEFLKEFVDGWVANPFIRCFNTHTESRHDLRDLRAPLDNGYDMYSWPQTPEAGTGKSSGQRQKGQTITHGEDRTQASPRQEAVDVMGKTVLGTLSLSSNGLTLSTAQQLSHNSHAPLEKG